MKIEYIVTKEAGREVAGARSPGEGKSVFLTATQAEHPLRLGHIREPGDFNGADPAKFDHDGDGRPGGAKPLQKLGK